MESKMFIENTWKNSKTRKLLARTYQAESYQIILFESYSMLNYCRVSTSLGYISICNFIREPTWIFSENFKVSKYQINIIKKFTKTHNNHRSACCHCTYSECKTNGSSHVHHKVQNFNACKTKHDALSKSYR